MKILKLAFFGAMLSFGVFSAQAEMQTPDILSSVSPESVQVLTKAESAATRGEYLTCHYYSVPSGTTCVPQLSTKILPGYENHGNERIYRRYIGKWWDYYVSR